jgi:tRNA modification GTPase
LRDVSDQVEREGIARTEKTLKHADLRLHVVDRNASRPPDFDNYADPAMDLMVLNKMDLAEHNDWLGTVGLRVSCVTGEGIDELEREILNRITKGNLQPDSPIAINARHRDCLRRALESCERARDSLEKKLSPEYVAVDLQDALRAVGEIVGTIDMEQVLDSVFGQFCIGK